MRAFNWKSIQISVVIIFKTIIKIALDIIRYLYRLLTGFVGIGAFNSLFPRTYRPTPKIARAKSPQTCTVTNTLTNKTAKRWSKCTKNFTNSRVITTFAKLVPAKPLRNAQIGGAFYFFSIFWEKAIVPLSVYSWLLEDYERYLQFANRESLHQLSKK